jgi:DNA polymerase-3 subunit epsilon
MFKQPVVYVDIETSGGSPVKSKIIEVGAIRVEDGVITNQYRSFVNPAMPLPYWITKITGITDADLIQAPYFDDIAYQLNSILDGAIFIAHNVRFDYSFIKKQLESCGYNFRPKLLCTVRLSRALYPEAQGHSLEKIILRHNIKVDSRHRAFDDAKAIKDFAELAYKEHGSDIFKEAISRQVKAQTIPPNLAESAIKDTTNHNGVYVFEDEAGRPLYIGKSKQTRSRVLSHFRQDITNSKEMKLSQSVHNLRIIKTSTELEALLLESKMVKELMPLHNRQLRSQRELTILIKQVNESGYINLKIESVKSVDPKLINSIYGVYTSRKKAKAALETKLRTYSLCPKLMGLEKTNKACFVYQLGKCSGACINKEDPSTYNQRLETAMQRSRLDNWPYEGAIKIKDGHNSGIVVDKWIIIGRLTNLKNKTSYKSLPAFFDLDTYRILRSYITKNSSSIKPMPMAS